MPSWWLVFLLLPIIASIPVILFMSRRKSNPIQEMKGYTFLAGELRQEVLNIYRKMVALLVRRSLPSRQPAQTPQEYANLVSPQVTFGMDIVRSLTDAANVAAYDSSPFSASVAQDARNQFAALPHILAIAAN